MNFHDDGFRDGREGRSRQYKNEHYARGYAAGSRAREQSDRRARARAARLARR